MQFLRKDKLIRNSFISGLLTFLLTTVFALSGDLALVLFLANILPGFFFGSVLSMGEEVLPSWRRVLFIFCSGLLYLLIAWLATDTHLSFHGTQLFILASAIGANGLLFLYSVLLRKQVNVSRGMLCATASGILSAFFPAKVFWETEFMPSAGNMATTLVLMSIFLTWQTFFGLTIAYCCTTGKRRLVEP